jgi:hypothetical protein
MKHNEKNIIVEDVLTNEEIRQVYEAVENSYETYLMKLFTQKVSNFSLPENIYQKIVKYSEEISGESDLEISEYQFARYQNAKDEENGEDLSPNLIPHVDLTFREPRFTFDYQIGGNTSWPLVVEEKDFTLGNNTALTFSGTHQVHWRTHKDFKDDEYIDMVFFHLRKKGAAPYSKEHEDSMIEKCAMYTEMYNKGDEHATS